MGAAQAGIFPCAAKAVGQTFPDLERARASGMLSLGMYIGTAFGPLLTALLLSQFTWPGTTDWRACLVLFALPGLLWSAIFLHSISPQQLPPSVPGQEPEPVDWGRILRSRPHLLLFAQQFLRACGMVFFTTWFPIYLQKARDMPVGNSGVYTFYAGLGGMAGSLLGGLASDAILKYTGNRWLSRQGIAVAGAGSCAVLAVCSYFIDDQRLAILVVSLGTFCATFGGVSAYTMAIEIGGKQLTPIFSAMNMSGNIGAMLFPITVGALVKATGDNWNLALFLFAGIMAAAAVCWAKIDPSEIVMGGKDAAR
jgi:MFS family permease